MVLYHSILNFLVSGLLTDQKIICVQNNLQVLTGGIVNVTNATVTGLSVIPATHPPSPIPPVIPPVYENATTDEGDLVITPVEEIIESSTVATGSPGENSTDTMVTIDFVIPTEMRVTLEPREVVCL